MVIIYGRVNRTVRPVTLRSIRDHDVLLDTAHDLLNSIVESSGQHN